ncbi:hypothetical protein [Streptomyces vastus]|uniref:WXG100 family type VII secretion target n=1 Tax=Streptomyces vastus TaxID=285451 RepID=A0ABN3RLX2_9ACTN
MAWDEWEQLKTAAAERQSAQMQLNQMPADQGASSSGGSDSGDPQWGGGDGGSSRLKSSKAAWAKAGHDVGLLRESITKALTRLADGQTGLGDTAGCQAAVAQQELYESWKRYVGDVSGRCGDLGGLLEQSGHDLAKPDSALKEDLDRIRTRYQDTEAVGGQAKEK